MLAAATQFWKQASPCSRTCFRPLSVMTSPLGFTTTSLGVTEMWYLVLSSLRERRGWGGRGQQGPLRSPQARVRGPGPPRGLRTLLSLCPSLPARPPPVPSAPALPAAGLS